MKPLPKWLMIFGVVLLLFGVGGGMGVTVLAMQTTFSKLSDSGVADPKELADGMQGSFLPFVLGFMVSAIGAVMLITGVIIWIMGKDEATQS